MAVRRYARVGVFALCVVQLVFAVAAADSAGEVADARATAQAALKDGKPVKARNLLKQSLADLRVKAIPADRQNAADLLTDLGDVYSRLGQETEAVAAFEEAANYIAALHGANDPRHGLAVDRLADAHVRAGQPAEAVPLYRGLMKSMRATLGRGHPGYGVTAGKLASAAAAAGKPKAAAKAYSEALELLETAPKPDDPEPGGGSTDGMAAGSGAGVDDTAAYLRVQYARTLAEAGKLEHALREATLARDAYASGSAAGSLEHARSLNAVAGVLERLGRDDEAIAAMSEATELARRLPEAEADPAHVAQAERNLRGLKKHVEAKRRRRAAEHVATHDEV